MELHILKDGLMLDKKSSLSDDIMPLVYWPVDSSTESHRMFEIRMLDIPVEYALQDVEVSLVKQSV